MNATSSNPAYSKIQELLEIARSGKRTLVMGILNVTPDSFSDGGEFYETDLAVERALRMAADGADIIDIGAESTRPATFRSHEPMDSEAELRRLLPVVIALHSRLPDMPISVDTYKSHTAEAAIGAGAVMINDISALRADAGMAAAAAVLGVPVCLMHMPGLPTAIPADPHYLDVVREVCDHLQERVEYAVCEGIRYENILIDPGIGFGKAVAENLEILRRLDEFRQIGCPLLIGTSRKSTIGTVLGGLPPQDRLEGTAATVALSIAYGAAIVRVHDVKEMVRVARMSDAIVRGWG